MTMRDRLGFTRLVAIVLSATICATSGFAAQKTVDQILTLVNGEVITRSDVVWGIALAPDAPSPAGHLNPDMLRQMLETVIEQRLILQEASRLPTSEIQQDDVDKKRVELIKKFKSEAEFRQRIESVGLNADKLDELIRQRIEIDRFVDFRFRSFVFVSEQDIQRFYDEQLSPEIRRHGRVPPPIKDVRELIVSQLREERVNEEIDRWLPTARQRAEIVTIAEPSTD